MPLHRVRRKCYYRHRRSRNTVFEHRVPAHPAGAGCIVTQCDTAATIEQRTRRQRRAGRPLEKNPPSSAPLRRRGSPGIFLPPPRAHPLHGRLARAARRLRWPHPRCGMPKRAPGRRQPAAGRREQRARPGAWSAGGAWSGRAVRHHCHALRCSATCSRRRTIESGPAPYLAGRSS